MLGCSKSTCVLFLNHTQDYFFKIHLGTNQDPTVMLNVNCRATGSYDCDYVAKGNTEEELIRDIDQHARQVHDLGPGGLPPQVAEKLKSEFTLYRSGGYLHILFMTLFNLRDISQKFVPIITSERLKI